MVVALRDVRLMKPSLIVIHGPSKGASSTLDQREFSIGRDPSNQLSIQDACISARHCVIRHENGQFKLIDLESRNGTRVNGAPVDERILEHGDRIWVGQCTLAFLCPPEAASDSVQLVNKPPQSGAAIRIRPEDTFYLNPANAAALPASARRERDFHLLLTIATKITGIREAESLQWQILGMIFDGIPAERGAILLADTDPSELRSTISWDRKAGPLQIVEVSREIAQQAMEERVGILLNDLGSGPISHNAPAPIASLICVPLIAPERVLGVIYLDSSEPADRFDEQHLDLLTAIASISALGLSSLSYVEALISENRRLREDSGLEHEIIGQSAKIQKVLSFISKVAPSDSTVLIEGESGTGKELVARAVHRNSARADKAFIALSCAALPENLIESELFGYEKGAFTGATATKRGQLEAAEGGTLLLDEIGELAIGLQAKLLRVLQEREFMRLGGKRPIKIDVRLIAATNRDLAAAVQQGTFRQDLYFRLNVLSVKLPALRERPEDISLLADYFVARFSQKCKRPVRGISAEARRCLARYDWPGNIRELENAIERAVVMGSTELLLPEDLPETICELQATDDGDEADFHSAVTRFKRKLVLQTMQEAEGNYAMAAKRLGLQLTYLYRMVRNLDLKATLDNLRRINR